jgi:signal transduction histidine kinase
MNAAAARLTRNVLLTQGSLSLGTALLVGVLAPRLVLLEGDVATEGTRALLVSIVAGGALSFLRSAWRMRKHRFVLRALALGAGTIEPIELRALADEPPHITYGWLVPSVVSLGVVMTVWRPEIVDFTTGATLGLLGAIIVAAASLPFHVAVRSGVLAALELAPMDAMREVIEAAERTGRLRGRVSRRLLAAVATPAAVVAVGSALIANAHLRRADERHREETARALSRAALELGPGVLADAGLADALAEARALGFSAQVEPRSSGYRLERRAEGIVELVTPLDRGSARVRFSGSTVRVLSPDALFIALLAVAGAAGLALLLGRALARDLRVATRGVRLLGTDAVLSGSTRILSPVRFSVVAELGQGIDRLAGRFRVFARAQERAIAAREAATRMRGLFFASVSHDLKGPLNAILGFTDLVRQRETLASEQLESLELIERRGRELLALIETILDAARVEAGQLTLLRDTEKVGDLVDESIEKGRDLGGDVPAVVKSRIADGIPELYVDRVRIARALATFIGHALRTAEQPDVWVIAAPADGGRIRIEVQAPSRRYRAWQLERMLYPPQHPASSEHRGLALGLRLARSVIELHDGRVEVEDRGETASAFIVTLPIERRLLRTSTGRRSVRPGPTSNAPAARTSSPQSVRPSRPPR